MNEERIAKVEGIVGQMNERLNHLREETRELRDDIKKNFRWTLGLLIPMWVTIIGSIFGLMYIVITAIAK